jgi:class 3 adenylate cyclase
MKRDPLLPEYLLNAAKLSDDSLGKITVPLCVKDEAGMLFTDICGFTKITELVSAKGHYGVEIIIEILNVYFEEMIRCLHDYGGSLLKFGGDALSALFPGEKEEVIPRMLSCCDAMYDSLLGLNQEFKKQYGIEINFNGAMHWGEIYLNIVGNLHYHYDYYIDGDALKELFLLSEEAEPGKIILSKEIKPYSSMRGKPPVSEQRAEGSKLGKLFLPDKVLRKMSEKGFSAELRNSAVIFIHLSDKQGREQIDHRAYHDYYSEIQRNVYNLDGTVNKIDYADKGYLILITFGTPYNHINDVDRAVTCCYRIQKIRSETISAKIGLTYSNIFAGVLGSSQRNEYGLIGNAVNIAARLMSYSAEGEISFSEAILANVAGRFETAFIEETFVKGIKIPLRIHKITGELPGSWTPLENRYRERKLVAYRNEIADLSKTLSSGEERFLILSGEAGTGKTFIAYYLIREHIKQNRKVSIHLLEEYNSKNQCEWFLNILNRKLTIDNPVKDFSILRDYCTKRGMQFEPELIMKFFRAIQDSTIELKEEEFEIVYANQAEILCSLLEEESLLFIDDLQFLDKSSYHIFQKAIPRLLNGGTELIVTYRGNGEDLHNEPGMNTAKLLKLSNLQESEAQELIKKEISAISRDAVKTIYNITKGNPLFIIEMCSIIKKNIFATRSIVAESDLKRLEKEGIISDKLENLLLNEYENLNEELKNTLKVASVIGKAFSLDEITIVSDEKMKEYFSIIDELDDNDYIEKKAFDSGIEYIFNNHLMRDAIYRTILLSQKRELHNKIGSFYEEKFAENLYPYLELLANHFIYAENRGKAENYSLAAGEKTARLAAYPESNYYYEKALSYCSTEQKCFDIILAMTGNYVAQGEANKADELIGSLEKDYPGFLNDEYYLLKVRTQILKGSFQYLAGYIPEILPKLKSEHHRNSLEFHYMNVLQYVNRLEEFEKIAGVMHAKLQKSEDRKLTASFLVSMGVHYMNRSDYHSAEKYYRELLEISEKDDDLINLRIALNGLGVAASRTGDKDLAKKYIVRGLEISEKLGDKNGYSRLIMDLGTLFRNEGDIPKAISYYEKSLNTARIIGNKHQEGIALYSIGEAYFYYLEDKEKALSYIEESKKISEKIGDIVGISFCNDAIGDINFTKGNYDKALKIYEENLKLQRELKDDEGIAHTLGNLGNIAKSQKDYKTAESYYKQQIEILTKVGDLDGTGRAYFNWAMIELEQERPDSTREKLNQSLALFRKCNASVLIDVVEEQLKNLDEQKG